MKEGLTELTRESFNEEEKSWEVFNKLAKRDWKIKGPC